MAFVAPLVTGLGSLVGGASAATGISLGQVVTGVSSILGGITAYGQGQYQAKVAENNAAIAEENAKRAAADAAEDAKRQDQMTAAAVGQQLSLQGASGVSTSSPSFIRTRLTERKLGRQDSMNIYKGGIQSATNFLNQAQDFQASAANARSSAVGGLLSGFLDASGTLVGQGYNRRSARASRFIPVPTARPKTI